jgi:GR25 family glycosyltransferase involved in LPS biosynthesis
MPDNLYSGLYLNLDRSTQRRSEIEQQLQSYRLADRYIRFPAVDGALVGPPFRATVTPGQFGCFQSHYEALRQARPSGHHVHIMEDDVLLSDYLAVAAESIVGSSAFERFDMIFTDTFVHPDLRMLRFCKQEFDRALAGGPAASPVRFQLLDLANVRLAGSTSYFVGPNSVDRVLAVYKSGLDLGPTMPIDICLRRAAEQGKLRIACVLPFVTTLRLEHVAGDGIAGTTGAADNPAATLLALLRYSFFIGRDLDGYAGSFLKRAIETAGPDAHRVFLGRLLELLLSDKCTGF